MPTTVRHVEKRAKRDKKKKSSKSDDKDDEVALSEQEKIDRDNDESLADEARRLAVEQADEDMGKRNDIFANTEGHDADGDDKDEADYDSSSSEIDESEIQSMVTDIATQRLMGKIVRAQKRDKEEAEERTDRLFAVTRSLCGRVTELESSGESKALLYPPKGWTVGDLRAWVLPEWESQRLGTTQGAISLSNPYEVPLVFGLSDVSCFRLVKQYVESVHVELQCIQLNGSSIQQQTKQINSLRSQLLKAQRKITAPPRNGYGTKAWFFRLSYPQQRHVIEGIPDDSDDWSIELAWHPEREIYRTLIQCAYKHTTMEQYYRVDEKLLNEMGEGWNRTVIKKAIDDTLRMFLVEVQWYDDRDPPLAPLGKYRERANGKAKGKGSVNHQFVNRANSTLDMSGSLPANTPIPGITEQALPQSMLSPPPPPRYAMAIGTGKDSQEYKGGGDAAKGSGKYGEFGKGSFGYGKSGKQSEYGGRSGGKFGGGKHYNGGGKAGTGKGGDMMQQLAALLMGGKQGWY